MANWCESCLYEEYDGAEEPCINCAKPQDANPTEYFPKRPPKPVTNYDRIISKTPEEMAEWMAKHSDRSAVCPNFGAHGCQASCKQCWLDWLKQEAAE